MLGGGGGGVKGGGGSAPARGNGWFSNYTCRVVPSRDPLRLMSYPLASVREFS